MSHNELIARLRALRQAAEVESETSVTCIETCFALVMWDVCGALGLPDEGRAEVLGRSADAYVRGFLDMHVRAREDKVAAVPWPEEGGRAEHEKVSAVWKDLCAF